MSRRVTQGSVLVVVPTYQEAGNILRLLEGIARVAPHCHVLVVDDSSPDGTATLVARAAENDPSLHLMLRARKSGLASAYLDGFRWGLERGFEVIVEMDADLSHRPEDLPAILEGASRYDLSLGSRYIRGGQVSNWSRSRRFLSRAANTYARVALRIPVRDMTSGFRAFRRDPLQHLVEDGIASEGYAFQIELVYRASRAGYTIGEIPIVFRERDHGASKLSRRIVFEALTRVAIWSLRDPAAPMSVPSAPTVRSPLEP
jgi:dolichol-phosphate mannosyltransferase